MKRRIIVMTVLAAASACSERGGEAARADSAPAASAWVQPPHIDGVLRDGGGLIVRGVAAPRARVVLRTVEGEAVAASADNAGRFELRLPPLSGDVLLTPEVQVGEHAAVSPETLVVIQGGTGPIALVAAGEPTVRLDSRGLLDAVDTDGGAIIASGRTADGAPTVTIGASAAQPISANGAWRATAPGGGETIIIVDGQAFAFPGAGSGDAFVVERAGAGWRLTWAVAPQGRQSAWLPDRMR
jgi:hypothetical protein